MQTAIRNVLALDVGEKRIGVAVGNTLASLARPLTTLEHNGSIWGQLENLIKQEEISLIVVGLPRGLNGQETSQTAYVRSFVGNLERQINLPIHFQDEALTSVQAETELAGSKKPYSKAEIDALAATYILNDFLDQERQANG